MENFCFTPQTQLMKNPNYNEFLAGDMPESLPAYDQESSISDSESGVSGYSSSSSSSRRRRRPGWFSEDLVVELNEEEKIYEVIRRRFLSCLGGIGERTAVSAIHRKNWSGFLLQASLQSFQIYSRALANKHGGYPNVKFAWYGDCREGIEQIISRGFSHVDVKNNNNGAVFLSADDSPADSVEGSVADEDGMRHVLLCRVILGRLELVQPGSGQTHPSSDEFDSGVDDLHNPKKYLIWSCNMNTHILPEYIVSFRVSPPAPSLQDCSIMKNGMNMKMPRSPWISFPGLISILGRFLPQNDICLINKYHKDYKERKMTRGELIQKVRKIAGDKLLVSVIKSCKGAKELKMSTVFLRNRNTNQE